MSAALDLLAAAAIAASLTAVNDVLDLTTGQAVLDLDGTLVPARLTAAELDALRGGPR